MKSLSKSAGHAAPSETRPSPAGVRVLPDSMPDNQSSQQAGTSPSGGDVVIRLNDVSVDLPIFSARGRSVRMAVLNMAVGGKLSDKVGRTVYVRALDRVSFDVYQGDRIGLLGHNGSGKSTLLKVLSSIYLPTSGEIESSLVVVPLLDFQLGVDEEMTGLEAIQVGCLLRGLTKAKMADAIAEICDFSELGDYLTLPIRTYSAGMRARLAFGTATAMRPEAIAIDENISTGDARFIEKARRRAQEFISGASVLFLASHSDDMLRTFCQKGIVLRSGRAEFFGPIEQAIDYYNQGRYRDAAANEHRSSPAALHVA